MNPSLLGVLTLPTVGAAEVITNSRLVTLLFCNDYAFVDLKIPDDFEAQIAMLKRLNDRVLQYSEIIDYFPQTDYTPQEQGITDSRIEELKQESYKAFNKTQKKYFDVSTRIQDLNLNKMLFAILDDTVKIVNEQFKNEQKNSTITSNPNHEVTHPIKVHERMSHFIIAFKNNPERRKNEKRAYIRHRYVESSLEVVFEFAYLARGAYIPDKVRSFTEFIDIFQDNAALQVAGVNDFASLSKEWKTGQTENLYILKKLFKWIILQAGHLLARSFPPSPESILRSSLPTLKG